MRGFFRGGDAHMGGVGAFKGSFSLFFFSSGI